MSAVLVGETLLKQNALWTTVLFLTAVKDITGDCTKSKPTWHCKFQLAFKPAFSNIRATYGLQVLANGWKQPSPSSLVVDWDSIENTTHVREMVALIKKGCGCRTGCQSSRCKYKKGGNYCFGCKCVGRCNVPANSIPATVNTEHDTEEHDTEESMSKLESEEELQREVDATVWGI